MELLKTLAEYQQLIPLVEKVSLAVHMRVSLVLHELCWMLYISFPLEGSIPTLLQFETYLVLEEMSLTI